MTQSESLPQLDFRERKALEQIAGRKFSSNEEAQLFQKQLRLKAATDELCHGPVKSRDVLHGDV